ncbi:hypothetical protein B0813_002211 [Candidatus Fervidibacteria bacterium JGI MDM2 SSWTFF-3-K9]
MCRNFSVGQEPDPTGYYSPFATRHSLFSIRHRFSARQEPHPPIFSLVPRPAVPRPVTKALSTATEATVQIGSNSASKATRQGER